MGTSTQAGTFDRGRPGRSSLGAVEAMPFSRYRVRVTTTRMIRHIQPLGLRVLVRVLKEPDVAESGLYLPAGAKEKMQEALFGEIIEVARAQTSDPSKDGLGVNVSGVPLGAKILFPKEAGTRIPWDEELRLLETKEVLATVDEIPADQAI